MGGSGVWGLGVSGTLGFRAWGFKGPYWQLKVPGLTEALLNSPQERLFSLEEVSGLRGFGGFPGLGV